MRVPFLDAPGRAGASAVRSDRPAILGRVQAERTSFFERAGRAADIFVGRRSAAQETYFRHHRCRNTSAATTSLPFLDGDVSPRIDLPLLFGVYGSLPQPRRVGVRPAGALH